MKTLRNQSNLIIFILFRSGKEDPEKSGYSAGFTGIFTKQALLAQLFPKKEILLIFKVVHNNSSTFTMVNPKHEYITTTVC